MNTNHKTRTQNALFGKGASQTTRYFRALDPHYVKLDDRNISELLAFSAEYADLLNYYNDYDEIDGSWKSFLTVDISVVLASIITSNIKGFEEDHNKLIKAYLSSRDSKAKLLIITEQFDDIFEIVVKLNLWMDQLNKITLLSSDFERNVVSEYFNILNEKAFENVRQLFAYSLGSKMPELRRPIAFLNNFNKLNEYWNLNDKVVPENIFVGDELSDKLHSAFLKLRILFRSFHYVMSYMVFHFKAYFEKSISSKDDHKPHLGLFIAFLKLFKNIQEDYNNISDRYLTFYFEKILRQNKLSVIPDKSHVSFEIVNSVPRYNLPKGVTLTGGLDKNGDPILFETVRETELTRAKIESIQSIYITRRGRPRGAPGG